MFANVQIDDHYCPDNADNVHQGIRKLSFFETKLISYHSFSNSGYLQHKKKTEYIYNSHQFEHLSHVFDAISFRSMSINKGFLVIEYIFLRHPVDL